MKIPSIVKRSAMAMTVLFFFGGLALVITAVVYVVLFGIFHWLADEFSLPDRFSWIPLAVTALFFLVAVITAVRDRLPDLQGLVWDSATSEDAPSRIQIEGYGGRFWNVNPLGHQTLKSTASVAAIILGFGPSLMISAIVAAIAELRGAN